MLQFAGANFSMHRMVVNVVVSTLGNGVGAGLVAGTLLPWANGKDPIIGDARALSTEEVRVLW